jgi:hypothetical protein
LETSREEGHFWNFVEGDPTFHFDLKCIECDTVVKFDELVALVMCTACDEECQVYALKRKLEAENTRVCIAVGRRPLDERKRLAKEKVVILQEYFDQQSRSLGSQIRVVPDEMVRSIDSCYAEVVTGLDMLFPATSEGK